MFGVVWDYYSSKLKGKQYKQNTTPKSYKTEIKILANPVSLIGLRTTRPSMLAKSNVNELVYCPARTKILRSNLEFA